MTYSDSEAVVLGALADGVVLSLGDDQSMRVTGPADLLDRWRARLLEVVAAGHHRLLLGQWVSCICGGSECRLDLGHVHDCRCGRRHGLAIRPGITQRRAAP